MSVPILTAEVLKRIEQAKTNALFGRLDALRQLAGNPLGVEIETFGGATAFSMRGIPGPAYNRVRGLRAEGIERLDDVLKYYEERGIPVTFDISPDGTSPALFAALAERGYFQSSFHTTAYGVPQATLPPDPDGLTIRELGAEEFDTFGTIYVRAFGMPETFAHGVGQNNKPLYGKPGWKFYLALVDNQPAAVGVLQTQDGTAYLAAAATDPARQRRGCQTALHYHRLCEAATQGCDLVVAEARFGSQSIRNMQHVGMQIAYTSAIWEKRK